MWNFIAFGYHTVVAYSLRETFKHHTLRSILEFYLENKMFQIGPTVRTFLDLFSAISTENNYRAQAGATFGGNGQDYVRSAFSGDD
ncbi:hypothetical protein IscW_ISCW010009 [Ixodes scapularis]|uniref:Uncharacterized protein n=1 Tax=Ixodes scapularis TaxID=6945 RepID=B7Q1H9_IXOSC|nr:hypothetical protein IscW_ISCW010009 [Ixodes scapularis]|eukprot:XP_002409653.1 hypothetical protein IscW_ISCW010009 [Ixodes scapularis]